MQISGHGFNRAETTAKGVAALAAGDAGAKLVLQVHVTLVTLLRRQGFRDEAREVRFRRPWRRCKGERTFRDGLIHRDAAEIDRLPGLRGHAGRPQTLKHVDTLTKVRLLTWPHHENMAVTIRKSHFT